jgi:hypothetical protein
VGSLTPATNTTAPIRHPPRVELRNPLVRHGQDQAAAPAAAPVWVAEFEGFAVPSPRRGVQISLKNFEEERLREAEMSARIATMFV